MTRPNGRVEALWRYPVKSLGGERVGSVAVATRGMEGDRMWALRTADGKIGSGKTTRRFTRMPGLLQMASTTGPDGSVFVRLPTGRSVDVDDPEANELVSAALSMPVRLSAEEDVSHFDAAPLHLVTTASLAWLQRVRPGDQIDVRRLRPNIVVATAAHGRPEDDWVGATFGIGGLVVRVTKRTARCVMTTMAQPGLPAAPGIMKELERRTDACVGVYATVVVAGRVAVGDPVVAIV